MPRRSGFKKRKKNNNGVIAEVVWLVVTSCALKSLPILNHEAFIYLPPCILTLCVWGVVLGVIVTKLSNLFFKMWLILFLILRVRFEIVKYCLIWFDSFLLLILNLCLVLFFFFFFFCSPHFFFYCFSTNSLMIW